MRLVKESLTKKYREDNSCFVAKIQQFHYETREEKLKHQELMEQDGYTDSGQVRENIGTLDKPEYVWFGSYYNSKVE